jgi:hypothetical protein
MKPSKTSSSWPISSNSRPSRQPDPIIPHHDQERQREHDSATAPARTFGRSWIPSP